MPSLRLLVSMKRSKFLTFCSQNVNSYMMYLGSSGVHSHTFAYEQKQDCPVCTSTVRKIAIPRTATLNELIQRELVDRSSLRLQSPSLVRIATGTTLVYMQKPPALEQATRANLDKSLVELIAEGEEITVPDPLLESTAVAILVEFT